jgi:hypothetical protein
VDGRRFDDLTRVLGGAVSRRGLARGVAATAVAGLLTRFGVRPAEAACTKFGKPCGTPGQCCSGACSGGICRCAAGEVVCTGRRGPTCVPACPAGQVLGAGCRCYCEGSGELPVHGICGCLATGETCTKDTHCCSGVCSDYSGTCADGCLPNGVQCLESGDCCSGFCDGTDCCQPDGPCGADFECCTNLCLAGTCCTLKKGGAPCSADTECCSGACQAGACCLLFPLGHACVVGTQCCSGSCNAGSCGPV